MEFDKDLLARQEARALAAAAEKAQHILADMPQEKLDAIVEAVAKAFSENAAEVGYKMIELEQLILTSDPDNAADIAAIESALTALEALYGALEGEDAASFADLESVYEDIVNDARDMID